jgi:hypothetical protein
MDSTNTQKKSPKSKGNNTAPLKGNNTAPLRVYFRNPRCRTAGEPEKKRLNPKSKPKHAVQAVTTGIPVRFDRFPIV